MPIYAYKCESCGFAKDVLQKMSDAPLELCPACERDTFRKQLTAAGFQLKGSGWYVTDFKGGGSNSGTSVPASGTAGSSGSSDSASAPQAEPAPAAGAAGTGS